ncbi:hypothetical protein ACWDY4_34535 [Streptomyces olivaceoviridis]
MVSLLGSGRLALFVAGMVMVAMIRPLIRAMRAACRPWCQEVTEAQLWNVFGVRGRHPYAVRVEADLLAKGESSKKAF